MTAPARRGRPPTSAGSGTINQDSPLVADRLPLFAVADGMGGHQGGEVASAHRRRAPSTSRVDEPTARRARRPASSWPTAPSSDAPSTDPTLRGMGTTLVRHRPARRRRGQDEIGWVNVGDSRIYLFRDGELIQLTDDHSLVERARAGGPASPPRRRRSTRSATSSPGPSASTPRSHVDSSTVIPFAGRPLPALQRRPVQRGRRRPIAAVLRRLADPTTPPTSWCAWPTSTAAATTSPCVVVDVVDDDDRAALGVAPRSADEPARPRRRAVPGRPTSSRPPSRRGREPRPPRADDARRRRRRPRRDRGRHVTWRVVAFVARRCSSSLGVGLRRDRLVRPQHLLRRLRRRRRSPIYQGRPGGVLWFDPTLEERPTSTLERRPARRAQVDDVDVEHELGSLGRRPVATSTTLRASTTTTTDDARPRRPRPPTTDDDHATDRRRRRAADQPPMIERLAPQHRARPDRPRRASSPAAPTRWPASADGVASRPTSCPFLGIVLGLFVAAHLATRRLAPAPTACCSRWPRCSTASATCSSPASTSDLAGLPGDVDRRRHRRLHRSRCSSCAGPATSSATATRSCSSASALLLLPLVPGVGRDDQRRPHLGRASGRSTSSPASSPRSPWPSSSPPTWSRSASCSRMATWPRFRPIACPTRKHLGPVLLAWGVVARRDDRREGPRLVAAVLRPVRGDALGRHRAARRTSASAAACSPPAPYVRLARRSATCRTASTIWLDPWTDASGDGFQVVQSWFALAWGGVAGTGPRPRQPRPHPRGRDRLHLRRHRRGARPARRAPRCSSPSC